MHYTHFQIENLKGIKQLTLDVSSSSEARIHTLVGLNESGKTTILEAIDLFTGGSEELDPKELAGRIRPNENDLVPIALRANFNGTVRITAGIHLDSSDCTALADHMLSKHKLRTQGVPRDFTVTDEYRFSNSLYSDKATLWPDFLGEAKGPKERKWWAFDDSNYPEEWHTAVGFLRGRMPAIWYFPNFLFDFPDKIFLRPQPNESPTDRFYRALLQDVLDALEIGATLEDHVLARVLSDKVGDARALQNIILQMSRRLSQDVFDAWKRILRRDVTMRVALSVGREPAAVAGSDEPYIEFQIEDTDGFFFVHERSLGFRWFFVFLLLTTFRGSRRSNSRELLFLFDEPASNLHPSAQAQLLESLERLATRSRVLYTTHSHHLVNPDWLEQTFVVRNGGADPATDLLELTARQTDIAVEKYRTFVARHPDQSQYFQPVLDVLDYAPSRLELVPELVLVEGKNDFYALRYGALLYGPSDLHFYPGGGAGSLDGVIALYLAWGRQFLVLLDSDSEGQTQHDRYLERFGSVVEGRILLVGDIIAGLHGKPLDSLFSSADRSLIVGEPESIGAPPTKKVFFRYLQEALVAKRVVSLSSGAEGSLRELLRGLNEGLKAASSS